MKICMKMEICMKMGQFTSAKQRIPFLPERPENNRMGKGLLMP